MAKDVKFLDKSRQTEQPRDAYKWIGKDMKRVEDPRLLAGKGIYIDDVQLPKMAHAAVLRSPHAHARIMSILDGHLAVIDTVGCVTIAVHHIV